jgi:quaternary ammonium compound-resistance protein SugE
MHWIFLILASCCEVLWFYCVGYLNKFSFKDLYTFSFIHSPQWMWILSSILGYGLFGVANVVFFSKAIQKISPAIAFAVWTGLALVGISLIDFFWKDIHLNFIQIASIVLILAGIIGIKITAPKDT